MSYLIIAGVVLLFLILAYLTCRDWNYEDDYLGKYGGPPIHPPPHTPANQEDWDAFWEDEDV